jgi:hypothetical protein
MTIRFAQERRGQTNLFSSALTAAGPSAWPFRHKQRQEPEMPDRRGYTEEKGEAIYEHLISGKSLMSFCRLEGNPSNSTVMRWLQKHPEFREKYTDARELQADVFYDQVLDIADGENQKNAWIRMSARMWMVGRMQPKKYGKNPTRTWPAEDQPPAIIEVVIDDSPEAHDRGA